MSATVSPPSRASVGHFARFNALVDDHMADLSDTELRVLLKYLRHADSEGIAYPSIAEIARAAGVNERSAYRAIRSLSDRGRLRTVSSAGGGGSAVRRQVVVTSPTPDATVTPDFDVTPDSHVTPPLTPVSLTPDTARPLLNKEEHTNNRPVDRLAQNAVNAAKRTTKKKHATTETPPIPSSLAVEPFTTAWADWHRHRREKNKRLKISTAQLHLDALEPLGPAQAALCIKKSIFNDWTGLFPEKFVANGVSNDHRNSFNRVSSTRQGECDYTSGPVPEFGSRHAESVGGR